MRRQGFILLPLIIIFSLLGVVGYLVYQSTQFKNSEVSTTSTTVANLPEPSSTPTSIINWNTYRIESIKFTFSYPPYITVESQKQLEDDPEFYLQISNGAKILGFVLIHKEGKLYVTDEDGPKDLTLNEWLAWNLYDNCIPSNIMSGYICSSDPYGSDKYIFVAKIKDRFIELTGNAKDSSDLKQILSTFKFTQ